MALNSEQNHILPAIAAAARLTIQVRDTLITRDQAIASVEKTGREPVTIADFGSQAIICRAIQKHFPDDAIVAEESAADFLDRLPPNSREQVARLVAVEPVGGHIDTLIEPAFDFDVGTEEGGHLH